MAGLFRKEALDHQSTRLVGEVSLAQPVAFKLLIFLLLGIITIVISYLLCGDYTRKESVNGYLQPSAGLAKVYASQTGILVDLYVQEGDLVNKNDIIAQVDSSTELVNGIDINQSLLHELDKQQQRLEQEAIDERLLNHLHEDSLNTEIEHLKRLISQQQQQQHTLEQRLSIKKNQLINGEKLLLSGHLSNHQVEQLQEQYLQLAQQGEELATNLINYHAKLKQTRFEIVQQPLALAKLEANLASRISELKQRIQQTNLLRSYQIKAVRSGRITNVLAKVGERLSPSKQLLTILPPHSELEAILFIPTRAFGFVKQGQHALLRYQAFPYQRFGLFDGKIKQVSQAVLLPQDITMPINQNEPVYKVVVNLGQQYITAYGARMPLQAGMLLEADIIIENRSLWHWLFEPLYSLRGRF